MTMNLQKKEIAPKEQKVSSPQHLAAKASFEQQSQLTSLQAYQHAQFHPQALSPASIRALQRTIGNAAVVRLLGQAQRERDDSTSQHRHPPVPADETELRTHINSARGTGQHLDERVQWTLEHGLGADLSSVRVHTDTEADHLSRSINAAAFTTGTDIFFRAGMYRPGSSQGLRLLAHEAAQQW
jgi:Domain of unknown function (DUF4157)